MAMTPQQIFEYKRHWIPKGYNVKISSDSKSNAKHWCKVHCEKHEWHMNEQVEPYIDQYMFEHQSDAVLFKEEFDEC